MKKDNSLLVLIICYISLLIIIILIATSISGCNTLNRAVRKRQWIERKQPYVLAQYCANIAQTDTIFKKGKDTIIQTYKIDTISRIIKANDTTYITRTVRNKPIIIHSSDTLIVRTIDTSGIALIKNKIKSQEALINIDKGKIETKNKWALIGWGFALLACIVIGFFIRLR